MNPIIIITISVMINILLGCWMFRLRTEKSSKDESKFNINTRVALEKLADELNYEFTFYSHIEPSVWTKDFSKVKCFAGRGDFNQLMGYLKLEFIEEGRKIRKIIKKNEIQN